MCTHLGTLPKAYKTYYGLPEVFYMESNKYISQVILTRNFKSRLWQTTYKGQTVFLRYCHKRSFWLETTCSALCDYGLAQSIRASIYLFFFLFLFFSFVFFFSSSFFNLLQASKDILRHLVTQNTVRRSDTSYGGSCIERLATQFTCINSVTRGRERRQSLKRRRYSVTRPEQSPKAMWNSDCSIGYFQSVSWWVQWWKQAQKKKKKKERNNKKRKKKRGHQACQSLAELCPVGRITANKQINK